MTYEVTYRDRSGAKARLSIAVAGRAECLAECKRRGITPMKIETRDLKGRASGRLPDNGNGPAWRAGSAGRAVSAEGANGKSADSPNGDGGAPGRRGPFAIRFCLCAMVAVVAAIGAWWWFGGRGATALPAKPPATEKPKAEKRPDVRPPKPHVEPATNVPPAVVQEQPPPPTTNKPPEFVKRPGALQLPDGKVLTFPPPQEGEIRKVYAYGHLYECDHEGNFRDVTKRQLFHTAFEANFLGLAVEDKPFIPAFLKGLDEEDVKKTLLKKYETTGDETEEEMAQLRAYDDMRAAALQYMEEGGSFDEFVDYFAKQVKEERETNAMCLREVMTLYKQGKIAEAKEMAEAANALKREKGMKELKLPAHVRAAFEGN